MSDEFSFWEFHGRFPILIVVAGLNLPIRDRVGNAMSCLFAIF
jgi:hypothetical protein